MAYIAVDIGHGSDTFPPSKGVYNGGKGYAEHDFNSRLGIELKKQLEKNGHRVIFGQQPFKRDVALRTRTNLYNREKVDLVVSLHANFNSNKKVAGRCVFYWGTSAKSKRLAQSVRDEIGAMGYSLHGNGLHAGVRGSWTNLHINRETNMPAILVEHGFMSNPTDFRLVFGDKTNEYVRDMAIANAKGIQNYLGLNFKESSDKPVAKPSGKEDAKLSFAEVVKKARSGGYGNMPERARNIQDKTEFTYQEIQNEINRLESGKKPSSDPNKLTLEQVVAKAKAGDYGNYPERKVNIEAQTEYSYNQVQNVINKWVGLGSKPKPKGLTFNQVVAKAKAGDYGNYPERKKRIEALGYDYKKVQAEVNRQFKGGSGRSKKIKVGDKVTANRLYSTGNSMKPSRTSAVVGYIEKINNNWRNPYRLERTKGRKNWLGFAKENDLKK